MTAVSPLLSIRDLRVWYPLRSGVISRTTGYVQAVDGVSLDVNPGETVALVGESGCGKSTLARAILKLEPVREGRIRFDDMDLTAKASSRDSVRLRRELQIVFQDPFSSLNPRMSVLDILTEGLLEHGLCASDEREGRAERLLRDVGMGPEALHRYPHEFSGGQRQRISIARALSLNPRLIVCDEAVSALDVSVQAQVVNLLMDLRDQYRLSYLFIAHDLSVVRHIADRVAVMYLGQIVEEGPADAVIQSPRHPYTRALVSAVPRIGTPTAERQILTGEIPSPADPPQGCRFSTRCPFATDRCRTEAPMLPPDRNDHRAACLRLDELD